MAKPVETTKNGKSNPAEPPTTGDNVPDIQVTHSDLPGDIVVTERNADGTTNTRILKNGQQRPNGRRSQPDPMNPFPNGFDMRGLTPEQQRRLRTVIRNGAMRPIPEKTPPNF